MIGLSLRLLRLKESLLMANYCRIPVLIQNPVQFDEKQSRRILNLVVLSNGVFYEDDSDRFYVVTIHDQRAYLADGDWILPEPDGKHYYPCKPDIFEATYELVDNSEIWTAEEQRVFAKAFRKDHCDEIETPYGTLVLVRKPNLKPAS